MWNDDEEDVKVDLDATNRLKKLKKVDAPTGVVSGAEFTNLLQER